MTFGNSIKLFLKDGHQNEKVTSAACAQGLLQNFSEGSTADRLSFSSSPRLRWLKTDCLCIPSGPVIVYPAYENKTKINNFGFSLFSSTGWTGHVCKFYFAN